mmetsp:Transcript_28546/g.90013  ORF Transcript_28546/g.90013 Transcript_28546/m.90013 type:complete len:234 (+) Transcript_28546:270-971(+)
MGLLGPSVREEHRGGQQDRLRGWHREAKEAGRHLRTGAHFRALEGTRQSECGALEGSGCSALEASERLAQGVEGSVRRSRGARPTDLHSGDEQLCVPARVGHDVWELRLDQDLPGWRRVVPDCGGRRRGSRRPWGHDLAEEPRLHGRSLGDRAAGGLSGGRAGDHARRHAGVLPATRRVAICGGARAGASARLEAAAGQADEEVRQLGTFPDATTVSAAAASGAAVDAVQQAV